jgi:DNA-binding beta-propeller fold protein YncE
MTRPQDVALDALGNLFIATDDGRVRFVNATTGVIATYAGGGASLGDGGPATQAYLDNPTGLALDGAGNLYIADGWGGRLRKVDAATKVITTVTGTDIPGFYGDGGPAAAAGLSQPQGVMVDTAGNVFVADTNANRIRAILACVNVPAPRLDAPAAGATTAGTGVTLSWSASKGAFPTTSTSTPRTRR